MKLFILNLTTLLITTATAHPIQHVFINPPHPSGAIPSVHQSACFARRILTLTNFGVLSTDFPSSSPTWGKTPSDVASHPIGLPDYIGACDPTSPSSPNLLAVNIATSFRNVKAGSNISLSLEWTPPGVSPSSLAYSPASQPRFALMGYLESISSEEDKKSVRDCFVSKHPDSKYWLPGNDIHETQWVRLVVQELYWVGGFGDRAYIGWIPLEEWEGITAEEIEKCKIPGE